MEVPMNGARSLPFDPESCLARTCLAWTDDGELSGDDRLLVLQKLARADGVRSGNGPDLCQDGGLGGDGTAVCIAAAGMGT
jgi:hypothetical protein